MGRNILFLLLVGLVLLLASAEAVAGSRAETNQERCYQAALALQPERAADLDWSQTPAAEKLAIVEAGIAAIPDCAYLHYLRGLVLDAEMGLPVEALEAFERAVEIIPAFDLAHENIAIVHRAEARRSFKKPSLRQDTKEDIFRLTRAVAALRQAVEMVAQNPLWGQERSEHLRSVMKEAEQELRELKAPKGNADFLDGDLAEIEVTNWQANIREGFGLAYPVLVTLKRGDRAQAASHHRRYGWIKVRLSDGRPGWIFHNLVK